MAALGKGGKVRSLGFSTLLGFHRLPEAVTLAIHLEDRAVVGQAVQERSGHALTLEDLQGQRISISVNCQDFRKELGVHYAPKHLASETVFEGMTLEQRHGEASEPAQIVAQCSFAGSAIVLPKGYV